MPANGDSQTSTDHSVVTSEERIKEVKEVSKTTILIFSSFTLVLVFFVLLFAYLFFREKGGFSSIVSELNPTRRKELVKLINDYDEFEVEVNSEALTDILYNSVVVPGNNCFITGKDKESCFDSEYLDIVFTPNTPKEAKTIDFGEGRGVNYVAQKKGSNTLEIVISISEYDETRKLLTPATLSTLINKSFLEALLYTTVVSDKSNFPNVRESVDIHWNKLNSDNTQILTIM